MEKGYYDYAKYGSIGISWVLSTSIYLYLGFKGGNYLDEKLESAPIFLLTGLIAAIALSLKSLISEILALTAEMGRADRESQGCADDSEKSNNSTKRKLKRIGRRGPKNS